MRDDRLKVLVRVQPNASHNGLVKYENHTLYVRLAAPPVDGKANEALIKHLSRVLDLPKNSISIARGLAGRNKTVEIAGIAPERFHKLIDQALNNP